MHVARSVSRKDELKLPRWSILCVLDYLLCCCLFSSFGPVTIYRFQPAARKGAEKSGPGAGFTVLSEKTLFLGQKVSVWQNGFFF